MKVVINTCYGGYNLSEKAYKFLGLDYGDNQSGYGHAYYYDRNNPDLIRCVEELGADACGHSCKLQIIDIPDDVVFKVVDYDDGLEQVEEVHRIWR